MHFSSNFLLALSAASAAYASPVVTIADGLPAPRVGLVGASHKTAAISAVASSTTTSQVTETSVASTVPYSNSTSSNSTHFSVELQKGRKVVIDGVAAMSRAYVRYTGSVPEHLEKLAKRSKGSVVATPQSYDYEYLAPITAGGQSLVMDFDTGSADLWVFSSEMSTSVIGSHSYYNPNKSSSSKKMSGYTWSITYGDGSTASGDVYKDKVVIAGVTATSQAVEAAKTVSSSFQSDTDSDGLVGLAFSTLNQVSPTAQSTWFDSVKSGLNSKLFWADLKKGAAGSYGFGYIDTSKYTSSSITYTSVSTSSGWWQFTSSAYKIGSKSKVSSSFSGIADTGTSLLLLPDAIVTAYWSTISGATYSSTYGAYLYPCSVSLPSLTIYINGYAAVVPGTYLNYGAISSTTCYGGLQSSSGIGIAVFGDIFLKSQFVVFDQTQSSPRLGFAAKST